MKKIIYLTILSIFLFSTSNISAISPNISTNGTKTSLPIQVEEIKKEDIYIKYSNVNGYSATGSYLIIKNDGEVQYSTINKPGSKTKKSVKKIKLTKNEFINLKSIVNNAKLFTMKDSYVCEKLCPTDMNSTSIEFHYYGKVKNISMYVPRNLPTGLSEVIKQLQSLQKRTLNAK